MRPSAWRLPLWFVLALAALTIRAQAAPHSVAFRTDDGVVLAGTWFEPAARSGPAVILVPMQHRSRHDWDGLGSALASQGIGALSFDLRGQGESSGAPATDQDIAVLLKDLAAARRYVTSRGDVLQARLGVAGASLGATLAAMHAAQAPGIASLALLSASSDFRGLRLEPSLRKYGGRTLFVSSSEDAYAARSVRELIKALGPSPLRETLSLDGAGHGTLMLSRAPDLARQLVDWFKKTLL